MKVSAYKRKTKGFTALYAVLVASLALSIGLAVANIALKESLLSSTAKESQFAFYAANSGIECAWYWDIEGEWDDPESANVFCNNQPMDITVEGGTGDCSVGCTFRIDFVPECVDVTVQKDPSGPTTLVARGYNTCDENNPRRVERGLGIIY